MCDEINCQLDRMTIDHLTAQVDQLQQDKAELTRAVARLQQACTTQSHEIEQVLGRALGYPRFKDDQDNFPGATDADGVCVGASTAESLAAEASAMIGTLRGQVERLDGTYMKRLVEMFHQTREQV